MTETSSKNGTVVLVHGFFRTERDMRALRRFLQDLGFHAVTIGLPATFRSLEECVSRLEQRWAGLPEQQGRVHCVGHSLGGLIIRSFLARNRVPNLGRCVLIASPVNGSALVDRVVSLVPFITGIFKGLDALRTGKARAFDDRGLEQIEFGVIAGTCGRLVTGPFLSPPHDGRIELAETLFSGMKEHIRLPFTHTRIHKKRETAELVARFLRTGSFGSG